MGMIRVTVCRNSSEGSLDSQSSDLDSSLSSDFSDMPDSPVSLRFRFLFSRLSSAFSYLPDAPSPDFPTPAVIMISILKPGLLRSYSYSFKT